MFKGRITAGLFNFKIADYFEIEEIEKELKKVTFA